MSRSNPTRSRIRNFFASNPGREMRTAQFAGWYGVHRVTAAKAIHQMVQVGELVKRRSGKEIYYTTPKESA